MTLCVNVLLVESAAVVADSRGSYFQGDRHRIGTDHAQKVFRLGKGTIASVAGISVVNDKSLRSIVGALSRPDDQAYEPIDAASELQATLEVEWAAYQAKYPDQVKDGIGVEAIVCGYNAAGRIEGFACSVPRVEGAEGPKKGEPVHLEVPGIYAAGRSEVMYRLFKGYDVVRLKVDDLDEVVRERLAGLQALPPLPLFETQDAIDLGVFIMETTIKMKRFTFGIQADLDEDAKVLKLDPMDVGGDIEVWALDDGGVRTIATKELHVEAPLIARL